MGICQHESSILMQRDLDTGLTLENLINDDVTPISKESINNVKGKRKNLLDKFQASIDSIGERTSSSQFINSITEKYILYSKENPLELKTKEDITQLILEEPIKLHNGNLYWGAWNENCQMEGPGKLYSPKDNAFAEGIWKNGILKYGRIMFSDNSIYEGEITNNTFNGEGKLTYPNGSIYEGNFKEGEREGRGSMKWTDGTTFWGEFNQDQMSGEGEFHWSEGYSYRGHLKDNMLQGKGVLTGPNKSKYEGEFMNNIYHGEGKYKWGSGQLYKGVYIQGKKNGKALYVIDQFQAFKGFFVNEKQHGYGEIITDEMVYKGLWRNGLCVEKGEKILKDPTSNPQRLKSMNDKDDDLKLPNMSFVPIHEDMNPLCLKYLNILPIKSNIDENMITDVNIEETLIISEID